MTRNTPSELLEKWLITEAQFQKIDPMTTAGGGSFSGGGSSENF